MAIFGAILLGIGGLISLVASIWFVVVAFKQSVLWGLGCLFVPFVSLIFLIMHWSEAKRPFMWSLLAMVLLIAGMIMAQPPGGYPSY